MSNFPPGNRDSHESFCKNEGWVRRSNGRGRTGTDHVRYELQLADGRVLYTRISRPVDRTTYGRSVWAHILRDQLCVTEGEFWACAQQGLVPPRSQAQAPRASIPLDLVAQLRRSGVAESDIAKMSREEAIDRMQAIWRQTE